MYTKISFYTSLHIVVALILVLVNKTDYFNIYTLCHFIIEITRFIFQKYGVYKILFFTILNIFSAIFTFYNKHNVSLEDDLCQNFFNHVEIRLFSIHPLYFESIVFLQLFNDSSNHIFRKSFDKSNIFKYILQFNLFLLIFVNYGWAMLQCRFDIQLKMVVIVLYIVTLGTSIFVIFYENKVRLYEIFEHFDIFTNRHLSKVYRSENDVLNEYSMCDITRNKFNFLSLLNHDYYYESKGKYNMNKVTLLKSYFIINSVLFIFFIDFYWTNDCLNNCNLTNVLYKNLLKISIIFLFTVFVKINLSSTLKYFLLLYPLCVSFVILSTIMVPKWSHNNLPEEHIYKNETNVYFETQDELSMYSIELKMFIKILYVIVSFPFYYYSFVKLYDHGIISSISTLSLLNLEVRSFTSFFINVCITSKSQYYFYLLFFTYIFFFYSHSYCIQLHL